MESCLPVFVVKYKMLAQRAWSAEKIRILTASSAGKDVNMKIWIWGMGKVTNAGTVDEYFWQDLWGAGHIISDGVKEHYDIGSRLDGFIAHLLAAGIDVHMIDVRPFPGKVDHLHTVVADATMMDNIADDSLGSLSALCSLEHFGLGRYGDPVDSEACFNALSRYRKN